MTSIFLFSFLVLANSLTANALKPIPSEAYSNQLVLQKPDLYYVFWKIDNFDITFELHIKQSKWVLFGIGGQTYHDVVVGWVNNDRTGHFSDRFFNISTAALEFDDKQSWTPIDQFKQNEYTVYKFTRKLKNCNKDLSTGVLNIPTGVATIVYATGNNFGVNKDIQFQTLSRASATIVPVEPPECEIKTVVTFSSTPTAYYSNYVDLVDQGQLRFYWNFTSTDLIGELHCKTSGWVGFGLSPNGNMDKSDVFIGWISNGQTNFTVINFFIYNRRHLPNFEIII
jgi:hypothetical protein